MMAVFEILEGEISHRSGPSSMMDRHDPGRRLLGVGDGI
jgi:hypothetical protein